MPGYFFDVSGPVPAEGRFEAPSDALVVVYDSSARLVKGVVTIGSIVERTGERASTAAVYDAVVCLLADGVAFEPSEPIAYEDADVEVVPFDVGFVVVQRENVGVDPAWERWNPHRVAPSVGSGLTGQALRAIGSLPGFPVTPVAYRWYVCENGDRHYLPVGSEGSECPTCGVPLSQDD